MPAENNSGMALIVTIAVVAVILTGALALNRMATDAAVGVHLENERFLAREKALSGIHLGMAILVRDAQNSDMDSVQEEWADAEELARAVGSMAFDEGDLVIRIEDELGKIQMNALIRDFPGHDINWEQRNIWQRFLELNVSKEGGEKTWDPTGVVDRAIDWLDSNDNDAVTGFSGAEADEYLRESIPYKCSNGPFEHPYEFFSLKGVDPESFRNGRFNVKDSFTVYGVDDKKTAQGKITFPGRININTAGANVLAALLPGGMAHRVRDLVDFREQKTSQGQTFLNTLDKGWYEKVIEFSEEEIKEFDRVIRYSSNLFSIQSTGRENKTVVRLRAVVERESKKGWRCRMIQLEREL